MHAPSAHVGHQVRDAYGRWDFWTLKWFIPGANDENSSY